MNKAGFFFGLLLLLASCSQDQLNPSSNAVGEAVVHLSLSTSPMIETSPVKSTRGTITTDPKEEDEINHITVLQFNSSSKALLKKSSMAVSSAFDIDIPLAINATGVKSNVYVVANMGTAAFGDNITEDNFKTQLSNAITTEGGFMLQNGNTTRRMPMFGQTMEPVEVTPTTTLQQIKMVRMLARVDVKYKSESITNFTVLSVLVGNVRKQMQYYCDLDAASYQAKYPTTIPTLASTDVFTTPLQTTDVKTDVQEQILTFYLPENHRGLGSNTGAANDEKLKDGAGTTYATYIEFKANDKFSNNFITYRFYPGKNNYNDYNLDRNTKYTLTATLDKGGAGDPRRVKVTSIESKSNCYIIDPSGGTVSIPISRANDGPTANAIPDISNPNCTASILWQTVAGASNFITLVNPTCKDGYFTVTAPTATLGNALVVIRKNLANGGVDPNGEILWSWHIWVTNPVTTITIDGITTTTKNSFMDRNLGATNTDRTNVGSYGFFYQWGRKDPQVGPSAALNGTKTFQKLYKADGTTEFLPTISPVNTVASVATSILNPSVFYRVGGDWTVKDNSLWGSIKTPYDPCPVGWRVPTYIGGTVSPWSGLTDTNWTESNRYPNVGRRFGNDGTLSDVTNIGFYWTGSVNNDSGSSMSFAGMGVFPNGNEVRSYGYSVRCVKE